MPKMGPKRHTFRQKSGEMVAAAIEIYLIESARLVAFRAYIVSLTAPHKTKSRGLKSDELDQKFLALCDLFQKKFAGFRPEVRIVVFETNNQSWMVGL